MRNFGRPGYNGAMQISMMRQWRHFTDLSDAPQNRHTSWEWSQAHVYILIWGRKRHGDLPILSSRERNSDYIPYRVPCYRLFNMICHTGAIFLFFSVGVCAATSCVEYAVPPRTPNNASLLDPAPIGLS